MILNVGGVTFETTAQTLSRHSSFFSEIALLEQDAVVFIDRDPTHFRHVLNYLRGGFTHPASRLEIQELLAEAKSFSLDGLVNKLVGLSRYEFDISKHLDVIASRIT